MFFAGIDIFKFKHDCVIIDDSAKVAVSRFTFRNDAASFNAFLNAISQFDKESLQIGFEATGHYGCNLKNFLNKNGYFYAEINPLLIHNFLKRKTLRRTKTDSADRQLPPRPYATVLRRPLCCRPVLLNLQDCTL